MILIISNTQDLTVDFVVRELLNRKIPFLRLNTDEFPTVAYGLASFGPNNASQRVIYWNNRNKILDFDTVTAVWYRRPIPPVPARQIDNQAIRKFCIDESYDFLRGLWLSLDCYWMSNPEAIRIAEHKVTQMLMAQKLGFRIPRTVITNDPAKVKELFQQCRGGIVIKSLFLGFIKESDRPKYIYTSTISEKDIQDIESVRLAPSIYQEKISKKYDLRVTVVGEKVFVARIEANLPADIPDWRFASLDQLNHSVCSLPEEIHNACIQLVKSFQLEFGAIDLAVAEDGEYVFFEINPNGQWAWLENILQFPISSSIVECLLDHR